MDSKSHAFLNFFDTCLPLWLTGTVVLVFVLRVLLEGILPSPATLKLAITRLLNDTIKVLQSIYQGM